jgi:hypothetical protein
MWYRVYTRIIDNVIKILWLTLLIMWILDGAKLTVAH